MRLAFVVLVVVACGSEPPTTTDVKSDALTDTGAAGPAMDVRGPIASGGTPAPAGGASPAPGPGGGGSSGSGGVDSPPGGAGGAPLPSGGTTGGSTGSTIDASQGEDGSAAEAPPLPGLSASPPAASFGFVTLGHTSAPIEITISNPHPTAATGPLSPGLTGPDAAAFAVTSNTCGSGLAPDATCHVVVTLDATVFGSKRATLLVHSDPSGPAFATLHVPLSGAAHQAVLSITPESFDFGALGYAASKTTTFVISNAGKARLDGIKAALTGFAGFSLAGVCPESLAPTESCAALAVTFTSTAQGYATAELQIAAQGVSGPAAASTLSGTGLGARLRINPPSLVVKARVGETKVVTLMVENYGTAGEKPTVSLVNATGAGAPFKLASDPCTNVLLPPGRTCNVTLTYRATTTVTALASLRAVAPGTAAQATLSGSLP